MLDTKRDLINIPKEGRGEKKTRSEQYILSIQEHTDTIAVADYISPPPDRSAKQILSIGVRKARCSYQYNQESVGLDPGFSIISLFTKFSKSGFNHLSDCICFHCSPIVPYLKQFLIHCNHPVQSSSLSTFL
jgi:uncharacterized membrane protein (GlpM family)